MRSPPRRWVAPYSWETPSITNRRSGWQLDAGAHALEEQGQLDHLGLDRGVLEDRAALGHRRGEQDRLGGADAGEGEGEVGALQPEGLGLQPVGGHLHLGTELAEGADVVVDRPGADAVAADEGDEGLADAVQQRADHQDGHPVQAGVRHRDAARRPRPGRW